MTEDFTPRPEHQFTFGLWTVGNPGRDPFGEVVRPPLDPIDAVRRLADLGAYGVSFHDNDLVPAGSPAADRGDIVKRFRRALDATGMHVPMVTTNLFWRPIFKEGAFTANDPQIRRFAVKKACEATELGAEFGANVFVLWGGREGMEAEAAKDVRVSGSTSRPAGLTFASPSNPSPMSPGATFCSPPSGTPSPSSVPSSGPTWWGSTPSSPMRP
jgi:xylose isomerase